MSRSLHPVEALSHSYARVAAARVGGERRAYPSRTTAVVYSYTSSSAESSLQLQSFDARYVKSLCDGNRQTQEHFVGYFTSLLRIKLRSRLQSKHAIDDVCQETFARVFAVLQREDGLRDPERLGAFVNSVCNNVLLETYRSSSRTESLDAEDGPEPTSTDLDALTIASSNQIKKKVRKVLHNLTPDDRFLLKAVFLDQRDRDEVCRVYGVDREYLRVLLHRAKQEFKAEYLKLNRGVMPLNADA
jgi:RNA polymerase sigma-70 factor, ECF subfamily